MTRPGQRPPELLAEQPEDRQVWDRGESKQMKEGSESRLPATGGRGGLAAYDLSACRAQDTARPSHAWAAPTRPPGQSLAGQAAGGGVLWH